MPVAACVAKVPRWDRYARLVPPYDISPRYLIETATAKQYSRPREQNMYILEGTAFSDLLGNRIQAAE